MEDIKACMIMDNVIHTHFCLPLHKTENPHFNVAQWYRQHVQGLWIGIFDDPDKVVSLGEDLCHLFEAADDDGNSTINAIELYHTQFTQSRFSAIQRNAAVT